MFCPDCGSRAKPIKDNVPPVGVTVSSETYFKCVKCDSFWIMEYDPFEQYEILRRIEEEFIK